MKKYNKIDLNGVFVWIILPILIFLFSMNSVYAYFTATATEQKGTASTATISIGFQNTEKSTISKNSTSKVVDGKVVPGDTIDYSGEVVNTGAIQIYCVLEFTVEITGIATPVHHAYYTATGVALAHNNTEYITSATTIAKGGTSPFTLTYQVPSNYSLDYAGKAITMTATAHAIQYTHVTNGIVATNLLLPSPALLPTGYVALEYLESTGTQYIDTGIVPAYNLTYNVRFTPEYDQAQNKGNSARVLGATSRSADGTKDYAFVFNFGSSGTTLVYWRELRNAGASYDSPLFGGSAGMSSKINSVELRDDRNFYVNGSKLSPSQVDATSDYTFIDTMYLFGGNVRGKATCFDYFNLKVYGLQMCVGGSVVRDLIPCYRASDNVSGMYDRVTGEFLTNQGTGTFNRGDEISVGIPSEYQQVEYIESTGTQYIDTGFTPNQDTRVVMDFQVTEVEAKTIFGSRSSATSNSYAFNISSDYKDFRTSYANSGNIAILNPADTDRHIIDKNKNEVYLDNTKVYSFTYKEFTTPGSMDLFAINNNGTHGYLPAKIKLFSCSIYDNGVLVRNFIPCVRESNGVIGMYDKVTGQFYTNAGTGTFLKGSNVY